MKYVFSADKQPFNGDYSPFDTLADVEEAINEYGLDDGTSVTVYELKEVKTGVVYEVREFQVHWSDNGKR